MYESNTWVNKLSTMFTSGAEFVITLAKIHKALSHENPHCRNAYLDSNDHQWHVEIPRSLRRNYNPKKERRNNRKPKMREGMFIIS